MTNKSYMIVLVLMLIQGIIVNNEMKKNVDEEFPKLIKECVSVGRENLPTMYKPSNKFEVLTTNGQFGILARGEADIKENVNGEELVTKKELVVKRIDKKVYPYNEIKTLADLQDIPGIPKFYGCEESASFLFINQEAFDKDLGNKEILKLIEGKTMSERLALFSGVAETLKKIHGKGIVHRDIKPENLMVNKDRDRIYIIDFGVSVGIKEYSMNAGTYYFLAPELMDQNKVNFIIDVKVDVWALVLSLFLIEFNTDLSAVKSYADCVADLIKEPVIVNQTPINGNLESKETPALKKECHRKLIETIKSYFEYKSLELKCDCGENSLDIFKNALIDGLGYLSETRSSSEQLFKSLKKARDACNRDINACNDLEIIEEESSCEFESGELSKPENSSSLAPIPSIQLDENMWSRQFAISHNSEIRLSKAELKELSKSSNLIRYI